MCARFIFVCEFRFGRFDIGRLNCAQRDAGEFRECFALLRRELGGAVFLQTLLEPRQIW